MEFSHRMRLPCKCLGPGKEAPIQDAILLSGRPRTAGKVRLLDRNPEEEEEERPVGAGVEQNSSAKSSGVLFCARGEPRVVPSGDVE